MRNVNSGRIDSALAQSDIVSWAYEGERMFDVGMQLERREWSAAQLRRAALRHPAMALKVLGGIYWQAFRLWWKRTPFHPHPRLATEDATCDS